eukprot:m.266842 g.266842  ORF g.266842 m.266842 type:complete len:389 (-) comp16240_c0_seq16:2404-3570(-)
MALVACAVVSNKVLVALPGKHCVNIASFRITDVGIWQKEYNTRADMSNGETTAICSMRFDETGTLLCACTKSKKVFVWKVASLKDSVNLLCGCDIPRRPTSLDFSIDKNIVVADKAGDVYQIDYSHKEPIVTRIAGHISMILDVEVSTDKMIVITSDRDEKIRVSRYPNAYNIRGYLLGHSSFVSCISTSSRFTTLVASGSGDGTVRLWDFLSCKLLSTMKLTGEVLVKSISWCGHGEFLVVCGFEYKFVHLLRVKPASTTFHLEDCGQIAVDGPITSIGTHEALNNVVVIFQKDGIQIALKLDIYDGKLVIASDAENKALGAEDIPEIVLEGLLDSSDLIKRKQPADDSYMRRKQERLCEKKGQKTDAELPALKKRKEGCDGQNKKE